MTAPHSHETMAAWAAGFLDGEGCFYATRNKHGHYQSAIAEEREGKVARLKAMKV